MRFTSVRHVATCASVVLLAGCLERCKVDLDTAGVTIDTSDEQTDDTATGDTWTDTETGAPPEGVDGSIQGVISVTLFEYDSLGDVNTVAWADSCFGEVFPYGDILVTAYVTDEETGEETYYGDFTIHDPSTDSSLNTYSIEVYDEGIDELYLYAVLDKWDDHIISPSDPIGTYGDPVVVRSGETIDHIDIEILTEYWCGFDDGSGTGTGDGPCPDCPPNWGEGGGWYWDGSGWVYVGSGWYWDGSQWVYGGGGGGLGGGGIGHGTHGGSGGGGGVGSCTGNVGVGGDLVINVPYNGTGSDVATVLYWPGTEEPWDANMGISVTGDAKGAQGTWGHSYLCNAGRYPARGCWDDNGNGMYDPTDTWGQPIDDDGLGLDTIFFGEEDTTDQVMMIPVDGSDFDLVPMVGLSGDIYYQDGDFDQLQTDYPGAVVYVAALKYGVSGDLDQEILEDAYDLEVFGPDDMLGLEALSYRLLVPAEVVTYLWAAVDIDGDEVVNQPGEPVTGLPGDSSARMSTGSGNQSGLDLMLVVPGTDI